MEILISDPFVSVLFITFGFVCLFSELFVVSFGILGVVGTGAASFGIYGFFHQGRVALAVIAVVATVAFVIFSVRFWLNRIVLRDSAAPTVSAATGDGMKELLGKEGRTLSELRPAGFALLEGKRVDVVSPGHFIADGAAIQVVDVSGNRIVVKEHTAGAKDAATG